MSEQPVKYYKSEFLFNEKYLSQIPALRVLIKLGFEYLSPEVALKERQNKKGNVLLEGILQEQLKKINRINYKGNEYLFSEENIQSAIQRLKNVKYDRLQRTNEKIYDLITLAISLHQTIEAEGILQRAGFYGVWRALKPKVLLGSRSFLKYALAPG